MHLQQVRRTAIAAFVAAAFSASSVAQTQTENLIVPGVRLGPISIGIAEGTIYSILGNPQSSFTGDEATVYNYPTLSVYVNNRSHKVYRIATGSSVYATKENIRVGSSMLEVVAKLGTHAGCNSSVGCMYWYKGLAVSESPTGGVVQGIWVVNN